MQKNPIISLKTLKKLYFELDDYFRPIKKELEKKIYQDITEIIVDPDSLIEGENKKELELEVPYGLIKITLLVHYKNITTPCIDDYSYQISLENILDFNFYDVFGQAQKVDIDLNILFEILSTNINTIIY